MQLIIWTLALITSSLCDLNQVTMGAEVELVSNILNFVHNYMEKMIIKFVTIHFRKYIKCSAINFKAA